MLTVCGASAVLPYAGDSFLREWAVWAVRNICEVSKAARDSIKCAHRHTAALPLLFAFISLPHRPHKSRGVRTEAIALTVGAAAAFLFSAGSCSPSAWRSGVTTSHAWAWTLSGTQSSTALCCAGQEEGQKREQCRRGGGSR